MSEAGPGQPNGFPARYFQSFSAQQVAEHSAAIEALQTGQSFVLLFSEQQAEVTFVARDYPGLFAILTGLLAAAEFDILTGDSYTSQTRRAEMAYILRRHAHGHHHGYHHGHQRGRRRSSAAAPQRGIIIDHFRGRLPSVDLARWHADLTAHLQGFMELLARDNEESFIEARRRIIERVSQALRRRHISPTQALAPVQIEIEQLPHATRLRVLSKDTPFFLYALSVALSFHEVSIIRVAIRTETDRIVDQFEVVDRLGRAIGKSDALDRIRLSILLGKQFTYFLYSAPDPYRALERFELIIQDFLGLAERGKLDLLLSSPKVLQDLARLLGASDFLWEDFLQRQYEMVLPILSHQSATYSLAPDRVATALQRQLKQDEDYDQQRRILNDFKDNEIFLIDLDHILSHSDDFFFLSSRLTNMAEIIVATALRLARAHLQGLYGRPRTAAGIEADCSILGLGKLGGQALGYASDIELLMVYSDDGESDGPQRIANSEYFDRLMRETTGLIQAKRDGIFQVDLRLRPHGASGPMAVSLAGFVHYYRRAAASLEKLALVRMRHIAGGRPLGERIEHIRDELIYAAVELNMDELQRMRATQRAQSYSHNRLNAKHSPGGLADLEHCVQILQVRFGRDEPSLRTPSIRAALEALAAAGRIESVEAHQLARAYRFLRALINGLRMLRGNARDLQLPAIDSLEYRHLARRMGYSETADRDAGAQLFVDFETLTAEVRSFVERQLGHGLHERPTLRSVADLVLRPDVVIGEGSAARQLLRSSGFANPQRALANLRTMAGDQRQSRLFAELAIMAWQPLIESADPDMALNNWERLCAALPDPTHHYRRCLHQPRRLDILLNILASSQFLADNLIADSSMIEWITNADTVASRPGVERLRRALDTSIGTQPTDTQSADMQFDDTQSGGQEWLDNLRRFRRRQMLRIAVRDLCLAAPLDDITYDLSDLADAILQAALEQIWEGEHERFAILAFGKLGGRELNYSSDIDLVAIFQSERSQTEVRRDQRYFSRVVERLRAALATHTTEGYAYRVDLRLRPFGSSGILAWSSRALLDYYRRSAAAWEIQALLKARPVAGAISVGTQLLQDMMPLLFERYSPATIIDSIRSLREQAIAQRSRLQHGRNIKSGPGGIRDIEFLVQGLQIVHARRQSGLLEGNTLAAISRLDELRLLPSDVCSDLRQDYRFLRRVEHFLQILEDRQVHSLPVEAEALQALERRMRRTEQFSGNFKERLQEVTTRVQHYYQHYLQR